MKISRILTIVGTVIALIAFAYGCFNYLKFKVEYDDFDASEVVNFKVSKIIYY